MSLKNSLALGACLALYVSLAGCSDTATNTTTNTNTATVTNANTTTTTTTTNTTSTTTNANKAPTKEDVEKNRASYEKQAKDAGRKIGAGANDLWLWTKTRYDLAAASDLRDSTINVDVENGVITLTGTVATQDQVKRADTIAKAVEGQKGVQNKLKVGGGTTAANANTKK